MRLSAPAKRGVAHGLFQQPEGRQVLGRTAADDVGPVALASEPGRERPERGCGEPVEEVERAVGRRASQKPVGIGDKPAAPACITVGMRRPVTRNIGAGMSSSDGAPNAIHGYSASSAAVGAS